MLVLKNIKKELVIYMQNFIILINLSKVSIEDKKFLLNLFGKSCIDNLVYTILNLSLSTKIKCNYNNNKYVIYYQSLSKIHLHIKSPFISVYGEDHNMYKKLTSNTRFSIVGINGIRFITPKYVRYLLQEISEYVSNSSCSPEVSTQTASI